jgi:enoyl-CoA hydratase/carnithine racemase
MIRTERVGSVTTLWLERPERRNALTSEMIRALGESVAAAEADGACHCLVIKGAGEHFCAGRDLQETAAQSELGAIVDDSAAYTALFRGLHRLSKPSVAVVHGYAVAGGFTLAMGCDFVLADESARFGALEMRAGFPAAVNTALLSRLLGPRRALELLLSQDVVPARTLLELGLLNRLTPDTEALAEAERDFVGRLVELDALAVRLTKETHRAAQSMPLEDALTLASQLNALLVTGGRFRRGAEQLSQRKK